MGHTFTLHHLFVQSKCKTRLRHIHDHMSSSHLICLTHSWSYESIRVQHIHDHMSSRMSSTHNFRPWQVQTQLIVDCADFDWSIWRQCLKKWCDKSGVCLMCQFSFFLTCVSVELFKFVCAHVVFARMWFSACRMWFSASLYTNEWPWTDEQMLLMFLTI